MKIEVENKIRMIIFTKSGATMSDRQSMFKRMQYFIT